MSTGVTVGYKQTEIGIIPSDWGVVKLGDISDFITSGSRGWARYYSAFGALFIRSQNVRNGYLDFNDSQFVSPPSGAEGSRTRVSLNDLLITITGNSVGNVAFLARDIGESYISQHVGLVRLARARSAQYICNYLAPGSPGNAQILGSQSGQSKPGLTLKNLNDFQIAIPSDAEQMLIVSALSDMDALISGLDQLIAKKRDIKQATMQQLLTGQTRLPGFSGEWEVKSLGDLETEKYLKLFRGKVISKKDIEKSPGNYPIFSSSVKENGVFGYYGEFMLDEELITWSVDGGGHFFYRHKHKFSVTNVCGYLRVSSPRINCRFLAFQLQFLHSRMLFDYSSKAHPSVIRKAYEIMLPQPEEQSAIASTLSDMDSEISVLEARRDKVNQIKQGMMQELLTGRIRLV